MYAFREEANCAGTDSEAFFTETGSSTYKELKMLKRICGDCTVQKDCLNYALKHNVMGYWGNTTEVERRRLRDRLGIIPRELYMDYN